MIWLLGTYSVRVTDANGCVSIEAVSDYAACRRPGGHRDLVPNHLQWPGQWQHRPGSEWRSGSIQLCLGEMEPSTQDRSALGPGTYTATITDANGCQVFRVYDITEPTALTTSFNLCGCKLFWCGGWDHRSGGFRWYLPLFFCLV